MQVAYLVMKKSLERAPLVQTLIDLRFAELPSMKSISSELQDELHQRMVDEGFPEKIVSEAQVMELHFDQATEQVRHVKTSNERLLFRAAGEQQIVEVSGSSIILKTTDYRTFEEFYGTFRKILKACLDVFTGLDKTLLKSVGLRYVDVIAPTTDLQLSDFVKESILPPDFNSKWRHLQGHTLKAMEVAEKQVLVVNFEELAVKDRKVYKVLPDNLIEPDSKCGLMIQGQKEWLDLGSKTYGILDVDHTHTFVGSPQFSQASIETATSTLYEQASEVFWGVITDTAKEQWGYKEV
ncbi:TIGR04255 family protein [Marinomonas flavescens]|uniref:TIGR04255 family protein n=1 Tax=Marinomonas flavescens TaxID=2529379 RepID=UPI001054FB5A|nr:TIGR04255 family protein [Marinomonas flavescens]